MTRVRLGELLLSRESCSREALSAAWEQKVLYGDRLGTNLLAIGAVSEADLAAALGVQHGVHAGYGGVLHVDPAAVALVPANIAIKRKVVPHHVADRLLFVLMSDPDNLRAIDEVRFASQLKVQPIVVSEARMWLLLAEYYGARAPLRPNPLDSTQRRPAAPLSSFAAGTPPAPDLVSEEDFQEMYARLAATPLQVGGFDDAAVDDDASGLAPSSGPPAAPVGEVPAWQREATRPMRLPLVAGMFAELSDEAVDESTSSSSSSSSSPRSLPPPALESPTVVTATIPLSALPLPPSVSVPVTPASPPPAPMAAPPVSVAAAEAWQQSLEVTNPIRAQPRLSMGFPEIELVEVDDGEPDTLPPDGPPPWDSPTNASQIHVVVDLTPLAFDEAVTRLKSVRDREEIARVVLRAARGHFARAALLTVYPQAFVGWQAVGEGFEDIVDVAIPADVPSVFSLVAHSRAHYLGPLQRFAAHGTWVKATGKRIPRSVAVLPILVRGRPVSLLYVDNGHDEHVGSDVGELLILAQHIAGSYEILIRSG